MGISHVPVVTPSRRLLPSVALTVALLAAGLMAAGFVGCGKSTPPAAGGSAQASPSASTPPTSTAVAAIDYCTLAERIGVQSGLMVNKHYISPLKETLDQMKALINLSLAAKDQPVTGLPNNVRAAVVVQLQYFQALKDNDFSGTTPKPAGYDAAESTVNGFLVGSCGFVFDK